MTWWGSNHVVLWDGNLFKGRVHDVTRAEAGRIMEMKAFGKFVAHSQDGQVWCATAESRLGTASLSTFALPQQDLTRFPLEAHRDRCWFVTPDGITDQ